MNPKFFNLPEERQDLIRNSAMLEFGESSFKKTSADSIAKRASISKGLLFHYFKDKRELYLYLFQYAIEESVGKYFTDAHYCGETDFFLALEKGHKIKMELVRRLPGLFRFVMRAYYERDSVLSPKLQKKLADVLEHTTSTFLARMDLYKFKDGVDPRQVIRLLTLASEGMLAETNACTAEEIDKLFQEYKRYADMLRQHLYKEEYL
ncbi:MAG: TetR/AcrR family transcriptional regulator [Oscillospiraceae bacterium]|jgi:TetR/AcrR family transcriptional regulator|nr:TetR/AcrR family transcriptional regulator [Oscillospiraceae bacterium]